MTTTTVQKWGNSLALRLPKEAARRLRIQVGSTVRIEDAKNGIAIRPVPKTKLSLKKLLAQITPANIHMETDWRSGVGKEIW